MSGLGKAVRRSRQEMVLSLPLGSAGTAAMPSETEVQDGGTWGMIDKFRATAAEAVDSMNWWLRDEGKAENTGKAVTQSGTSIVDIQTSETYGIHPTFPPADGCMRGQIVAFMYRPSRSFLLNPACRSSTVPTVSM